VTRAAQKTPLVRRPAFWLIVVLVIVIPALAFLSTQLLLRFFHV
jgi:hypothetical protein